MNDGNEKNFGSNAYVNIGKNIKEKIFIVYSLVFGQTSLLFRIDGQNYKNILS
jgi:hypothetical protein